MEDELEAALERERVGVEDASDFEVTSGGGFVDGGFGGDDKAGGVVGYWGSSAGDAGSDEASRGEAKVLRSALLRTDLSFS